MRLRALVALLALFGAMLVGATPAWAWGGWSELPGGGSTPTAPAVVPGSGEVFVRGTDDRIYVNYREGGGWNGWVEVPGGGRTKAAPAAVRTAGVLWIAVRGTDDYIYLQSHSSSGGWSGWWRATVQTGIERQTTSRPALANTGASQPSLFIRGKGNDRIYEYQFGNGLIPYAWNEVPGGGRTYNGPAAHGRSSGTERTYLVVSGTDSRVYYNVRNDRGQWQGWREFSGGGRTNESPAVSGDSIGNITLFVRGTDDLVYQSRGGWSAVNAGKRTIAGPSAAYTSYGHCVFIRGASGDQRIYYSCN